MYVYIYICIYVCIYIYIYTGCTRLVDMRLCLEEARVCHLMVLNLMFTDALVMPLCTTHRSMISPFDVYTRTGIKYPVRGILHADICI